MEIPIALEDKIFTKRKLKFIPDLLSKISKNDDTGFSACRDNLRSKHFHQEEGKERRKQGFKGKMRERERKIYLKINTALEKPRNRKQENVVTERRKKGGEKLS